MLSPFHPPATAPTPVGLTLLDRDHSILAFNARVFDCACRPDVPLLERLRFLCIVSSNLDEFFEVRAEPHLNASQRHADQGQFTVQSFERLARVAHTLVERQYALYTDWSHLTADPLLTSDMEKVFVHLASHSRLPRLNRVLLAPFDLHRKLIVKIHETAACAAAGGTGRIVAKMNALTDEALVHALIHAGQQGVKIDLIVRGACMLPAQVPGWTPNIRVRSVIGRFLEHSRVFYFGHNETEILRTYALTAARNAGFKCSLPGMRPVTKAATTWVNNSVFHW